MTSADSMISKKQVMTLRQIGYSQAQIDDALSALDAGEGASILAVLRRCYPFAEKKSISLRWRPTDITVTALIADGFLEDIIDMYYIKFSFDTRYLENTPRDIDAFFVAWMKNRIKRIESCHIDEWRPEFQVREVAFSRGISKRQFEEHEKNYRQLAQEKGHRALHGKCFLDFVCRMSR